MAYSHAVIPAAQQAFFDADKPVILAHHAIREATKTEEKWNVSGLATAPDVTLDGFPVKRSYDGFAHQGLHTMPVTSEVLWYLVFDFSATPITFDSVVLHTSTLWSGSPTILVQIADNANFSTNPANVALFTPVATDFRFVELELDHTAGSDSRLYSDVPYLRLRFSLAAGVQPRVREFWVGQRQQLSFLPDEPWGADHQESQISSVVSKSGVITNSRQTRGGAARSVNLLVADGAVDTKEFSSFWDDSAGGTKPFYWIETPSSDPQAYLMRIRGEGGLDHNPILQGPLSRNLSLPMVEQNPYLSQDPT